MSKIIVSNVTKTFKVAKRNSGLRSALKSFFKREYVYIDAVKDINFSIEEGEIVGYIGPNGAGKSTTIKMLSGILTPISWDIPAEDTFDLLHDIYKIPDNEYYQTKEELVKLLGISEIIKKPVRTLSLGERMRCEIASALLHKPKILFLDEPTIGLDAISKNIVRDFIKKINKKDKITVILTTHDMADIEALAKRIILIGNGSILYDGNLEELKHKFGSYKKILVVTSDKIGNIKNKGVIEANKVDNGYMYTIDSNVISVSYFLNYLSKNYDIEDIEIDNESIDNIIIKLYEEYNL